MSGPAEQHDAVPPEHHALVKHVAQGLRHRCGVREGDAIVVACSGGGDSVALLRALHLLATRRTWRLRLVVGHVHHHLRESAGRDARLTEQVAGELELAFARRDLDCHPVRGTAPALPSNLEARARSLRYAALTEIAAKHEAAFIATAHHADDQLETMLMRLMRGTGVRGLRGIAWRRRLKGAPESLRLIRPMLAAPRETARGFLAGLGQDWAEDETNADQSRRRAQVRHTLLPALREIAPDLASRTPNLHDHFTDLHHLIRDTAAAHRLPLQRPTARGLNPVVVAEVIRRELKKVGVPADRLTRRTLAPLLRAVLDRAGGTRRFTVGPITLVVTAEELRLEG